MSLRKQVLAFAAVAVVIGVSAALARGSVASTTLTVCPSGCAFSQIAPAVAAAKNGDTISLAPGTYDGGFTIDVSVKLAGAGPGRTVISGGGPVITIGQIFAANEPTVAIEGVTITGGVTRTSPESVPCFGPGTEGVVAAGGGIDVPPSTESGGACSPDDFGGGAAVTITNSVITGNRVAPSDTVGVALAFGGGINTSGSLTLANTTISNNRVGSASGLSELARFAEGAGIFSGRGDVTITNSTVRGNQAAAAPDGIVADAGGIASNGTVTLTNSFVTDNSATVNSTSRSGFIQAAGMHIKGGAQTATISNTTISGNTATVTNSSGFAFANSGGLSIDVCPPAPCLLSNDELSHNRVSVSTLPGSSGDAEGHSGAGEFGGTIVNVRLTGNSLDVSSAAGNAAAFGGASVFDAGTISDSVISDNEVHASAPLGSVDVRGGGLNLFGPTTLRNSTVSGNSVDASGASGSARGGGIFDIAFPFGPNGPPLGGPLVLQNSNVTSNTLSGAGALLQGGGIFAHDEAVTLTHSSVTQNMPDQCVGC